MSIDPGVRLVAEGSGDFIGLLPATASTRQKNDEVVYGAVTYKIESIQYVAEYSTVGNPEAPDLYDVHGRTDLIVSVVP